MPIRSAVLGLLSVPALFLLGGCADLLGDFSQGDAGVSDATITGDGSHPQTDAISSSPDVTVTVTGDAGADGEPAGDGGGCTELAGFCTNRCGSVYDNCGSPEMCGQCEGGVTCIAGSCGCDPEPATTTCANMNCGAATNNCGQVVACGTEGTTSCGSRDAVCLGSGTCCVPDDVSACLGKCNTSATNNCGLMVTCAGCGDGGVCTANNSCCTPEPLSTWCANRCESIMDSCGQPATCPECEGGAACMNGACGCLPDPVATTCAGMTCGTAVNNCGQQVPCGSGGTANCSSSSDVCDGNTCCTPDNVTACMGLCNTTATNNCGQTVTCSSTCPNAQVCMANDTCCTPNDTAACSGLACGPATDNCGVAVTCPNTCTPPQTCAGGTGGANACGCTYNGNACVNRCGGTATTNCGATVSCPSATCSGAGDTCVDGAYCYCGTLGHACTGLDSHCCMGACQSEFEVCNIGVIGGH